ncbi:right-handed parallel beta-helix repeat-containing protein [Bacillus xiapuensis]|uniref:Right-handed parallel beta-helix repeat-containing protein n=1 Tax=Bacillus xiapuensis TaxID=2014075 RepID=A0ABU6NAC8_9BACI|nr:right-handed parallel beta-helix repeat-containing protein [Bacillus xiapuensis]
MDFNDWNNDPIIAKRRSGTYKDPFRKITETLGVINGKATLTEIPNKEAKVIVTGAEIGLFEVIDEELDDYTYQVDYTEGVVFFKSTFNNRNLTFTYLGEGRHFFPDSGVWISQDENGAVSTAKDKFKSIDNALSEQKGRLDVQINSVPQPSEILDMRVDNKGNVFTTAKNRIDAEQKKIEEAYRDVNGQNFTSLKNRIDSEQKKIEEAYLALDGSRYFSLKERIDAEQRKIQDTYIGKDKRTYSSMQDRFDGIDDSISLMKKRVVPTAMNIKQVTDLKEGEIVRTLGYSSYGDGGAANYEIKSSNSTVDNSLVFNLYNGLKAHLILGREMNVKQFGALGNGINDDAKVIQNALDLALTLSEIKIEIPIGVYNLTSELLIRKGTKLIIHPRAILKRKHSGNVLRNYKPGENTPVLYNGNGDIYIEGGIFDCNGIEYIGTCNGISLAHAENITLRGITVKDTVNGHAIELAGVNKVLVDDCKILGYIDTSGGTDLYYVEAIQIEPCLPADFSNYYGDYTTSKNITIQNCRFGNSDTKNATPFPCAVGSHGAGHNLFYDNVRVINNYIDGASYYGIRLFKYRNSIITNNIIENSGGGVYIVIPNSGKSVQDQNGVVQPPQPINSITIDSNIFNNITGKMIYVEGKTEAYVARLTITNNIGNVIGGRAFDIQYVNYCIIMGNIIENVTGRGLHLFNSYHTRFVENMIKRCSDSSIFVDSCNYVDLVANTINETTYYGINITGNNTDLVIDANKISNSSQISSNYDCIIVSNGSQRIRITANVLKTEWGFNKPRYGLNVQSGVTGAYIFGNDFKCGATVADCFDAAKSTILWTGNSYMAGASTATPTKKLSECRNGWVLVWSDYDPGVGSNDYNFVHTMVPKEMAQLHNGAESYFSILSSFSPSSANIAGKALNIYDDRIVGNDLNGTGANGGKYSDDVCLRYIIEY